MDVGWQEEASCSRGGGGGQRTGGEHPLDGGAGER